MANISGKSSAGSTASKKGMTEYGNGKSFYNSCCLCLTGLEKYLNSSFPSFGLVALRFCLPSAMECLFLLSFVWLNWQTTFCKPLTVGQVTRKSYLPRRKIYLSRGSWWYFREPCFMYRCSWFSRDIIAAVVDDINERFLTNLFCLCHPRRPLGLCHLKLSVSVANHQYSRTLSYDHLVISATFQWSEGRRL